MKGKGNDGKGDIPERDLWETKQEFFNDLNNQYRFTFDCCANKKNKKCEQWHDDFENVGIIELSHYVAWMNPPFSNALKMFEHFFKVVNNGVAIYRCDNMETKVWQSIIFKNADWIFIPKGRVSYTTFEVGNMRGGNGTRFPSALIGVGVETPKKIDGSILLTKLFLETKKGRCRE
jgi:phage N-6-adenine-methyltransferase